MHEYEVSIYHHERGRVLSADSITVSARTAAEAVKRARDWAAHEWGRTKSCGLLARRYRAKRVAA